MIPYLLSFSIYIFSIYVWERRVRYVGATFRRYNKICIHILGFFLVSFPIILFYGLRVDVGTDYNSYIRIYNGAKHIGLWDYIRLFINNKMYEEPAYHLINRISYLIYDNEHTVFIITGFVMFATLYVSLVKFQNFSQPFAVFIFLMTQFCYAVNGVRFALAYCIILLGIRYIVKEKLVYYFVFVLIASSFHKTAICCIAFWFLKEFKNKTVNFIRNLILYTGVVLTPIITRTGMVLLSRVSYFERYFRAYQINLDNGSIVFLWRCLPPIMVILILLKYYHIELGKYNILLKIELCRIPLLYIGYYFVYAGRLDRYAWIAEIILVPYVIDKIPNRKNQFFVYTCFILWYLFIFYIYYVIQADDLFPYKSILFNL